MFVFLPLQPVVVVFSQPGSGLYTHRVRSFLITHNDTPYSVGLLWTHDQSVAETDNTQHSRQTNVYAPPVGFEPTVSAGERPKTYALDRAATGTGITDNYTRT